MDVYYCRYAAVKVRPANAVVATVFTPNVKIMHTVDDS